MLVKVKSFQDRLKEALALKSVLPSEVSKKTGISKASISRYLTGEFEAKQDNVYLIADFLNVSETWLMGFDVPMERQAIANQNAGDGVPLHTREATLLDKYRLLNDEGKDQADDYVTMLAETPKYTDTPLDKVQTSIIYYDVPVSAGTGQFLSDSGYIMLDVTETPPDGAEFIVRVCGSSMEPTYKDGDKLYIAPTEQVQLGDIGIFSVNGEVFVKEYGAAQLISHNPDYEPIGIKEDDNVHCFGKVVGVCKHYR